MIKKSKIFQFLYNDYTSFFTFIGSIISTIFSIGLLITQKDADAIIIFGSVSILLFMVFIFRCFMLNKLLKSGIQVTAEVTDIFYIKDRGRINYMYTINNVVYTSGWAIMRNKKTNLIKRNDKIQILVNPNKPKQTVIESVFVYTI